MSGSLAGAVDASIPLKAAGNPLESVGNFARTLGAINNTKLQQQALQSGTMSLWQQQKQLAYAHIAPLVAQGRINNLGDLTSALAGVEANGGITAPFIKDMVDQLGVGGGNFIDNLKAQAVAGTQPPEKAVGALAPAQSTLDQGLVSQPMLTGAPGMPNQGVRTPVGEAASLGAPPGAQGQPVTWKDTNGVEHQTTWAEYNAARGNGQVLGPAAPVLPGSPAATAPRAAPAAGYSGRFPTSATAPAPGLTDTTGPTPGMERAAEGSATQYIQDRAAAGSFATRVLPLKQGLDLLSDTDTGPGSETANHFRSVLISAANQGLLPRSITPDAVAQAKFDELKKYFAQYITGMPFAGGSDARMAEAVSGSPNTTMATLANKDVAKVLVGVERFRAAQSLAFDQAAQHGKFGPAAQANPNAAAGQYANFASQFNQQTDPRAFAYDLMTPAARGKMIAKMSKDERDKYAASLKTAYGLPGLMQ